MPGRHNRPGHRTAARGDAVGPAEPPPAPDVLAAYFRALGDPTRLSMLEPLADRERSVSDIVAPLGLTQPNVSNHLGCMRRCGLVSTRRARPKIIYRIADARLLTPIALARELIRDREARIATCRTIDATRC